MAQPVLTAKGATPVALHVVPHAVTVPQAKLLAQGAAVGVVQAPPVPLQLLAGVNMLVVMLHVAAAHGVAELQQSTLQRPGETH